MESAIDSILSQLQQLWRETTGSPEIVIAVLDGPVELSHQAFNGVDLTEIPTLISRSTQGAKANHGTHVASIIFGQHGGPVQGIAPSCKGLILPVFSDDEERPLSQLDLSRAINQAVEEGAHIINISGGQLTESGEADPLLEKALELCRNEARLVIAATGNDGCACLHVPAAAPSTLAVGAIGRNGKPLESSNWGDNYRLQGILAPGEGVLGAITGGGVTQWSGSSFATPIVTGIAALLMSIQKLRGESPDTMVIRNAILQSALPCPIPEGKECNRYLRGALNIRGAYALISRHEGDIDMSEAIKEPQDDEQKRATQDANISGASDMQDTATPQTGAALDQGASFADEPPASTLPRHDASVQTSAAAPIGSQSAVTSEASGVVPANEGACGCNGGDGQPVFFIGELNYDFGTEARRDSFKQKMPYVEVPAVGGGEVNVPPNPYDHNQMADHLGNEPEEATQLIWTLNLDLQPIYAVEPTGPYAEIIYDFFRAVIKNQIREKDKDGELNPDYVERMSIAGQLTGKTVRLFSGQTVAVIKPVSRSLFSWEVNKLVQLAVETIKAQEGAREFDKEHEDEVKDHLRRFLDRVYYDLRNLGVSARERALNYASTNAFQIADVFIAVLKEKLQLSEIQAEKSPFCRMYSDCWDVKLRFFDPENVLRAKRVFRFTVDVSDTSPVSVGEVRAWEEA